MKKYAKRLKTLGDLRRFLAAQITCLDMGDIDEERLRCMSYAVSTLAGIIRDSDLEDRLAALEAQALETNNKGRIGK